MLSPNSSSLTDQAQLRELRSLTFKSVHAAYAPGTYNNLRTQWRAYLRFTIYFGLHPVPASTATILLYAQFLSNTHAVPSIKNYVSGVHSLHKYFGAPFPDLQEFLPSLFFRGLARLFPHIPHQALPITPLILSRLALFWDLSVPSHLTMWTACLIAFFSFARKSILFPPSQDFNPNLHLSRGHISICDFGLLVTFTWSKTIQTGGRSLQVPIVSIPGSRFCPLAAYKRMIALFPASPSKPVFLTLSFAGVVSLTHRTFVEQLRDALSALGLPAQAYSGHSFRRGGASWAFQAGVPGELVKLLGDWRSDAYLRYLDAPVAQRLTVSNTMAQKIKDTLG